MPFFQLMGLRDNEDGVETTKKSQGRIPAVGSLDSRDNEAVVEALKKHGGRMPAGARNLKESHFPKLSNLRGELKRLIFVLASVWLVIVMGRAVCHRILTEIDKIPSMVHLPHFTLSTLADLEDRMGIHVSSWNPIKSTLEHGLNSHFKTLHEKGVVSSHVPYQIINVLAHYILGEHLEHLIFMLEEIGAAIPAIEGGALGMYNTIMLIILNSEIWSWNVVHGIPTAQNVTIPLCEPVELGLNQFGCSSIWGPNWDPSFPIGQNKTEQCRVSSVNLDISVPHVVADLLNYISIETGETAGRWGDFVKVADGPTAKQEYMHKTLRSLFAPGRVLPPDYSFNSVDAHMTALFPEDRYPASAIELMVFEGIGQHRVVGIDKIKPHDPFRKDATYAVYLNFAADLDVDEGYAQQGADAYFGADKKLTHIVREGRIYKEGDWDWDYAMMCFRGTLFTVVTAFDHLNQLHLKVANGLVMSNLETLPADHHLRRLNSKFTFRTIAINRKASLILVPDRGLLRRGIAFSNIGLRDLWRAAGKEWTSLTLPYELMASQGLPDGTNLPLHTEGLKYWYLLDNYVGEYFKAAGYRLHGVPGEPDDCANDPAIAKFWVRMGTAVPDWTMPPGNLTCDLLAKALASVYWSVSALHNYMGTVGSEVADPCFAPFAWREGELCSPPRNAFSQALTLAATSLYQPLISESYEHLFLTPETKDVERAFIKNVSEFRYEVSDRPYFNAFQPIQELDGSIITPQPYNIPYRTRHFGIETGIAI